VPDPFVLDNGDAHSDYWTFSPGALFPVLHSTDLEHWSAAGTAMMTRPSWVVASGDWHPWAPSVIESNRSCPGTTSPGCYVMYYVGQSAQLHLNCIGVATSPTPGGPYSDQGPLPGADPLLSACRAAHTGERQLDQPLPPRLGRSLLRRL